MTVTDLLRILQKFEGDVVVKVATMTVADIKIVERGKLVVQTTPGKGILGLMRKGGP